MNQWLPLFISLCSLSVSATELLPLSSALCLNNLHEQCPAGTELLYAREGCGCLSTAQYNSAYLCARINLRCQRGSYYSPLTRFGSNIHIGCDCFTTAVNAYEGKNDTYIFSNKELKAYTQEEFETLKREKTQEIWNSASFSTRFAYMLGNVSGYFKCQINGAWTQFYKTHADPSGRDWSLDEGQHYDLEGHPCNGMLVECAIMT